MSPAGFARTPFQPADQRGYQAGLVRAATVPDAIAQLERNYALFQGDFPALIPFRQGLPALEARLRAGETALLDAAFLELWREAGASARS